MKKLGLIIASAAALLLAACNGNDDNKESGTEVGLWYAYNTPDSKDDVAFVLDLRADSSAEFIISAYGCRWQGTYTYDGAVVSLTWNKYLSRLAAIPSEEAGYEHPCAPENLYKWWEEVSSQDERYETDATQFGQVIEIAFTYEGDKGVINLANKPCVAERQK